MVYTQFTSDLTYGRGCILYIKSNIPVSYTKFNNTFQESVWCSVNLIGSDKLLIGCVYSSPNSNAENNQEFLDLFLKVKYLNPCHLLIMGDFNLREINWIMNTPRTNETHFASQFLECVMDCFFYQHVKDITRYRVGFEPPLLDLFTKVDITNMPVFENRSNVIMLENF